MWADKYVNVNHAKLNMVVELWINSDNVITITNIFKDILKKDNQTGALAFGDIH